MPRPRRETKTWSSSVMPRWFRWGDWKGTIYISDQGCTYGARLIVSGPARGRVVYQDAQGNYPPYFVKDPSFLDWYERWLEHALAGEGFPAWDNPSYASSR